MAGILGQFEATTGGGRNGGREKPRVVNAISMEKFEEDNAGKLWGPSVKAYATLGLSERYRIERRNNNNRLRRIKVQRKPTRTPWHPFQSEDISIANGIKARNRIFCSKQGPGPLLGAVAAVAVTSVALLAGSSGSPEGSTGTKFATEAPATEASDAAGLPLDAGSPESTVPAAPTPETTPTEGYTFVGGTIACGSEIRTVLVTSEDRVKKSDGSVGDVSAFKTMARELEDESWKNIQPPARAEQFWAEVQAHPEINNGTVNLVENATFKIPFPCQF